MAAVRARFGPQAVAFQTGWPLVRHPLMEWIQPPGTSWGTPNVASVASLCEAAGRMGQVLTVGSKYRHDLRRTRTLVLWGSNPTHSTPLLSHVGRAEGDRGTFGGGDPIRTELAAAATEHLAVRPRNGRRARARAGERAGPRGPRGPSTAREETVGFEALVRPRDAYPPGRVAAITGLQEGQVVRTARAARAETPTGIWTGLGVEHHQNGVQTVRAIAAVEALCRRAGEPEIRQDLTPVRSAGCWRSAARPPPPPHARAGSAAGGGAGGRLRRPSAVRDVQPRGTGERPRPGHPRGPSPIRCGRWCSSPPTPWSPRREARRWRGRERLELLVSVDPFLTASGRRAHVVLPAATFAESEGVGPSAARGVADWKVVFELARAMGLGKVVPLEDLGRGGGGAPGPGAAAPELVPGFDPPVGQTPLVGTPSGKIELASSLLERAGHPPLPEWVPPSREPTAEYPLRLVSGPRTRSVHQLAVPAGGAHPTPRAGAGGAGPSGRGQERGGGPRGAGGNRLTGGPGRACGWQ
jgi:anaerobic selenocysteine-containing dehydrogenase